MTLDNLRDTFCECHATSQNSIQHLFETSNLDMELEEELMSTLFVIQPYSIGSIWFYS